MSWAASRTRPLRHLRWLAAGAMVAGISALPSTPGAAAQQPEDTGLQRVNAIVSASLAHVQTTWKGWLVVDRNVSLWNGWYESPGVYGPWTVTTTCSGFVASSDGAVMTAGHCVDANGMAGGKGAILSAAVADITSVPWQQSIAYSALAANADIEGLNSGAPPDRTVKVTVPALSMKTRPASVQDVQPFNDGDVALLTVTGLDAPALPVADTQPASGVGVVAAGYSGAVMQIVDSDTPPTFNDGSVSGTETVNGTPFTSISARTSPGMSGGPVVDMDGNVVGTVSWAPTDAKASSDFMTTVGSLHAILSGNGIDNTLGDAEQAYRDGLTAFYESRYHDAVTSFDAALALEPSWKMVTKFRQQAVAKYPEDVAPPETGTTGGGGGGGDNGVPTWVWYAGGGGIVVVVAGLAGLLLVMRRRRARPTAATAAPPVPPGMPPAPPTAMPAPPMAAPRMAAPPVPPPMAPPPGAAAPAPAPAGASATGHVFCPNCGKKHDAHAHYCEDCGQPFAAAMPEQHDVM